MEIRSVSKPAAANLQTCWPNLLDRLGDASEQLPRNRKAGVLAVLRLIDFAVESTQYQPRDRHCWAERWTATRFG